MLDEIRQKTSQLSAEVDQLNRDKVDLQRQAEAAARIPQRLRVSVTTRSRISFFSISLISTSRSALRMRKTNIVDG